VSPQLLVSIPSSEVPGNASWNILIFAPANFFDGADTYTDTAVFRDERSSRFNEARAISFKNWRSQQGNDFKDAMLAILAQTADILAGIWQRLSSKILRECNTETITIMHPEEYVHLLYDDSTFRRSRFYFWAIGCLSLFEQSIASTLLTFKAFRIDAADYNVKHGNSAENKVIEEFDAAYRSLDDIQMQLEKKLGEMRSLRDGVRTSTALLLYDVSCLTNALNSSSVPAE
jgi:hypothetical protein